MCQQYVRHEPFYVHRKRKQRYGRICGRLPADLWILWIAMAKTDRQNIYRVNYTIIIFQIVLYLK